MVYAVLAALVVASSGFVPAGVLPGWLQGFTTGQPITPIVDAARSVLTGGAVHASGAAWASLVWCAALLLVLGALVLRRRRGVT